MVKTTLKPSYSAHSTNCIIHAAHFTNRLLFKLFFRERPFDFYWGGREDFWRKKIQDPILPGKNIQDRGKRYSIFCIRGEQKDKIASQKKQLQTRRHLLAPRPALSLNQMVAPVLILPTFTSSSVILLTLLP